MKKTNNNDIDTVHIPAIERARLRVLKKVLMCDSLSNIHEIEDILDKRGRY